MGTLLSILITTYNRGDFLAQCLDSIEKVVANQKNIEMIVFDNGSADNTMEVLKRYENRLPIRILHEDDNKRFVYGILKCISHAVGKYCWFLGDDDFIIGEMDSVMPWLLKDDTDIFLMDHIFYIVESGNYKYLNEGENNFLFRENRSLYEDYKEYFLNVRHPNAFFLHIAPVIFRRSLWNRYMTQEAIKKHSRSESTHVYAFMMILKNSPAIRFIDKKMVALRVGAPAEENLMENGRYNRVRMDAEFFTDMVRDVFHDEILVRHFKAVMLKKSVVVLLLGSKIRCKFNVRFYLKVFKLLYSNYRTHPFFWYGIIPVLMTPRIALVLAYRLFVKKAG